MTKKIFAMFLAVLMVVSLLPTSVFAAEACPKTHSLENCTDYSVKKVTAPTCAAKGFTTYQCNECDATFVGTWTEATGEHDYVPAETQPAYCGVKGHEGGEECSVCGDLKGAKDIPAIGEEGVTVCEFGEWTAVEFDCTKPYTRTRACANCSNTEKDEYKAADVAEAHNFGEWKKISATVVERVCSHEHKGLKCTATETMDVVDTHEHDEQYLLKIEATAAEDVKCDNAKVNEHYICRECGKIFEKKDGEFVETTIAKLTEKTPHQQLIDGLDCLNTSVQCPTCEKVLTAENAHKYTPWYVVSSATCVLNGFQMKECTVCGNAQTEVIPALGHEEYTFTVDATCTQFGYTFTACVRPGCKVATKTENTVKYNKEDVKFDLTGSSANLTAPVAGLNFYMNLFQAKLNKTLFVTGVKEGKLTTGEAKEGAMVLEQVTAKIEYNDKDEIIAGKFYLKLNDQYVTVTESKNNKNESVYSITLTDEATSVFTWNETLGMLTTTVKVDKKDVELFLGNSAKETTVSAIPVAALEGETAYNTTVLTIYTTAGVNMTGFTAAFDAGFAAENHDFVDFNRIPSTCTMQGSLVEICSRCGALTDEQVLELAEHKYKEEKEPATCLKDGKLTKTCSVCGDKVEETLKATGHTAKTYAADGEGYKKGDKIVGTTEASHTTPYVQDYYTCKTCGEKFNYHNSRLAEQFANAYIFENETKAADWHTLGEVISEVKGDCTKDGYTIYSCTGCSMKVYVAKHDTDGDHAGIVYVPATCTEGKYFMTFDCTRCEKTIGEKDANGNPVKNYVSNSLGHKLEKNDAYEASTCANPNLDADTNYEEYCTRTGCGYKTHDFVENEEESVYELPTGKSYCEAVTYTVYYCRACDADHIYNFVGNYGHKLGTEKLNVKEPTCASDKAGSYELKCEYCAYTKEFEIAIPAHKDADDNEFYKWCLEEAKHCVVCCKCTDKDGNQTEHKGYTCFDPNGDKKTDDACSCVLRAGQHAMSKPQTVDSVCGDVAHVYTTCSKCFYTEVIDGHKYNDKVIEDLGHRPVKAETDRYAAYVYDEDYAYEYYYFEAEVNAKGETVYVLKKATVDNGMAKQYPAKYLQYKEATLTETGVIEFVCADCGKTIKEILPVVDELEFSAEIQEGDYTYGSLVAVDVYVNGAEKEIFAFNFGVNASNMVFVGADTSNTEWVVNAKVGEDGLAVMGTAANIKISNKEINGKTWLATLYFRVTTVDAAKISVNLKSFSELPATKVEVKDGKVSYVEFDAVYAKASEVKTITYMDLNGDGSFTFHDVYYGIAMLNLETEEIYNVAGDIDQDGKFTIADLDMMQDVVLKVADAQDLVLNGVSEEEAILMGILTECATCKTVYATDEQHTCPEKK